MKRLFSVVILSVWSLVALDAQTVFPTGCAFDESVKDQVPMAPMQLSRNYQALPEQVSLRPYCPSPKSQAPYNTCVGWATAYAGRSILEAVATGNTDRKSIDEKAFSPSYVYNQIRVEESCQSSAYLHKAGEVLMKQGCARMDDFPFDCESVVDEDAMKLAASFRINAFLALAPYREFGQNEIDRIKKSISQQHPVAIAFQCYGSFMDLGSDGIWKGVVADDPYHGHHAMVVIGYDEAVNGGSFEIMNSWGARWGDKGFAWVSYADMMKYCEAAYELAGEFEANNVNANQPSAAGRDYKLSGAIRLTTDTGEDMPADLDRKAGTYRMRRPYKSGTRFRIYVANDGPAFVYVLGADMTQSTFPLFPYKEGISAALTYSENEIALPSENAYIKMDNTVGTDYICVLYAKKPIDIEGLRKQIEAAEGTFQQKLQSALGERFSGENFINYERGGIVGFSAAARQNDVVPVLIEIEHTK